MPSVADVIRDASVQVQQNSSSAKPGQRDEGGATLPGHVVQDEDTWVVTLQSRGMAVGLRLGRGAPGEPLPVTEVAAMAADGRTPLTPDACRTMPFGELFAEARAQVAAKDGSLSGLGADAESRLAAFLGDRRGSRIADRDYALLADVYVSLLAAGNRKPAQTLSDRYGHGSPNVWTQRIREARRRGLLTDAPQARSGGRLTSEAQRLLGLGGQQTKG